MGFPVSSFQFPAFGSGFQVSSFQFTRDAKRLCSKGPDRALDVTGDYYYIAE
jgi:hypothetical protein